MRKHNEVAGGTWEDFNERNFPGPGWAYAFSGLPWIGGIGLIVIARVRRARRKDGSGPSMPPSDA
jgi:hypothetical protein